MALSANPKALLLDLYHRKNALSQLPNGYSPYFQLGEVVWGYGLIDDSSGVQLIEDIPSDFKLSDMETQFAKNMPSYTYVNGKIVIVATLPVAQLDDAVVYPWSMLTILDNDGEAVGVAAVNVADLTNKMQATVTLEINTVDDSTTLSIVE